MNSAVALGKLGCDTHFLGRISRDAFGRQLRQHILEANVTLDLATESSQATSIAVVSLDEHGVASYTFHFNDTANFGWQVDDLPVLNSNDWLHIASLSCVVSPGAEVLLDWMQDVKAGVSYDINVRPTVITDPDAYWSKVQPWLRVVGRRQGIVKASDEDINFLADAASSGAGGECWRSGRAGRPLGRTVRAGPWGDHTRARWWSSRRAGRKHHARTGLPHQGGRHGWCRRYLHGWLPRWLCEARARDRSLSGTRCGGRLYCLLPPRRAAADIGRGGRSDRRERLDSAGRSAAAVH